MPQRNQRSKTAWVSFSCVLILCLPVVGCSRDSLLRLYGYDRAGLLRKNMPKEDEALARDCVDLLLRDQFADIEARMDPSIRRADTRDKLAEMSSLFPSKPISVKPVEASVVRSGDSSTASIILEYQFERSWLLAHFVIHTKSGVKTITAFTIVPTAEPVEVMNEFTLADKGFAQYAGILLAVFVTALTLYAFVLCARMQLGPKKLAWLLVILVGISRITVNWTTGQWSFTPVALCLPPVTATCTPYGPWLLQIFSPLGAIAFLRLRKKLALDALPLSIVPDLGPRTERPAQDSR